MSQRLWNTIRLVMIRNPKKRADFIREKKLFGKMGNEVVFQGLKLPLHSKLIKIHDNVTIAANVTFITHDVIHRSLNAIESNYQFYEKLLPIEIEENTFVGANSIICGNVHIGKNSIIAAGSVVVKDVPAGTIVGGNPAKIIGKTNDIVKKRKCIGKMSIEKTWELFYLDRE